MDQDDLAMTPSRQQNVKCPASLLQASSSFPWIGSFACYHAQKAAPLDPIAALRYE
jgi:hypothetical protein